MDSPIRHLWNLYGRSFIIALLTLYLPHTWVFWMAIKYPSNYHAMWVAMFPTLPGGYIAAVVRVVYWNTFQTHLSDWILLLVAACFSLVLIAILTIIGARGKGWQITAVVLGGAYSIVAAMGLYAAFRM